MLGYLRIDQLAPDRLQRSESPALVDAHQPRIACDISGEDRGKTADGCHINSARRFISRLTQTVLVPHFFFRRIEGHS